VNERNESYGKEENKKKGEERKGQMTRHKMKGKRREIGSELKEFK